MEYIHNEKKEEYIINDDNTVRYVLGKYTTNPLIVFGVNPSTASLEKNDTTISIIEHIAEMRNCDGYLMFNIYPQRATNIDENFSKELDENICNLNLHHISDRITKGCQVVAAWGTHICDRGFFVDILIRINEIVKENDATWICLSKTKSGHPHHPTRLAYNQMTFELFDMDNYIKTLKK